jgi:photosystem II stability/assembly factor-like uncharacterized protein
MRNILIIFKKTIIIFLSIIIFLVIDVNPAFAHRPHDVIEQIAISPQYSQDQTLLIIVRGNLFKSTDGGESWQRIVRGIDNKHYLSSLSMSPQNTNTVFLASLGDGVYKSENGGNLWGKVNEGLTNLNINLLAVSPHSDNLVLAAGKEKDLYLTEDGGKSWQPAIKDTTKITAIAFFPNDPNKMIAGSDKGSLYLSENGGKSWQEKASLKNSGSITALSISPQFAQDKMWLVGTAKAGVFQTTDGGKSFVASNQGLTDKSIQDLIIFSQASQEPMFFVSTWNDGFFESSDRGKTWKKHSEGLTKDSQADEGKFKLPHFTSLRISKSFNQDKTLFLAGFNGLFQSTNGGESWQEVRTLSTGTVVSLAISPNYQNDSTLAVVTYVGNIYLSQDRGKTWKAINQGLEIPRFTRNFEIPHQDPRRFFDIAFSPNYPSDNTLFASVLWSKILKSTDRGNDWQILSLPKEVRGVVVAPSPNFAADKTIYVATQQGIIFKSTNGGQKFSVIGNLGHVFGNDPPVIAISPQFATDKTLYVSAAKGIYKTVDGGTTWQLLTEKAPVRGRTNLQLAISPNYAADKTVLLGTDSGLFMSKDGGNLWENLEVRDQENNPVMEGVAISPDYQRDRTFIVSVRGKGLYKTTDAGKTFTHLRDDAIALARIQNLPSAYTTIQFSPGYAQDQTIYGFGSASTQVYRSTNGGNTWETLTIPENQNNNYNFITWIRLVVDIYRTRIIKFVLALIAAGFTYFLLGYLGLEKKLPLRRWQIQSLGAFTILVITSILFFH